MTVDGRRLSAARLALAAALLGAVLMGTVRPAGADVDDVALSAGGPAAPDPGLPEPLALLALGAALAGASGLVRRRSVDAQVSGGSVR